MSVHKVNKSRATEDVFDQKHFVVFEHNAVVPSCPLDGDLLVDSFSILSTTVKVWWHRTLSVLPQQLESRFPRRPFSSVHSLI